MLSTTKGGSKMTLEQPKYAIYRHENALGNSAEQVVGLCRHFNRHKIFNPKIFVEKQFQKDFALCIPGITEKNIAFFDPEIIGHPSDAELNPHTLDIHFSNAYREHTLPAPPDMAEAEYEDNYPEIFSYPGSWSDLAKDPDCTLEFPYEDYKNKFSIPDGCIAIQFRENGSHFKRVDGAKCDPNRFVNIQTFFDIALYYAKLGYTVVRLGDANQAPMPKHDNIIDFPLYEGRTMLDDLFVLARSSLFISTDSGIWPMAGGMKKNLLLTNLTSVLGWDWKTQGVIGSPGDWTLRPWKPSIVDWLPKKTTTVLHKRLVSPSGRDNREALNLEDNSFIEIVTAANHILAKSKSAE